MIHCNAFQSLQFLKRQCRAAHTSFSDRNLKSFGGIFRDCAVAKFKMASRSGGDHEGKSNNYGQKWIFSDVKGAKKEWKRCHKHIYLESNIFKVQRHAWAAHDTVPSSFYEVRNGER